MIKNVICFVVVMVLVLSLKAQNTKSTKKFNQLWFSYHNQTRLTEKWELSADVQLRTREDFVDQFSQRILRLGLSWYLNSVTKFSVGYAYSTVYTTVVNKNITQPEHRPWQQFQWETKHGKAKLVQRVRLEERFRREILHDTIVSNNYKFNFRIRYNIGYEIPLSKYGLVPKRFSLILNEDISINLGKEIVYNYFDQNRLFAGLKYQINRQHNLTVGYMNLFQQTAAGNKYIHINGVRFIYFQNFNWVKNRIK